MPNVLVIGFDPHTIPGFDPNAVAAAIEQGSRKFAELGLAEDLCLIDFAELGPKAEAKIVERLQARTYDAVVVGGGIRKAEELLEHFEAIVNLVHWYAPKAAIAFNSNPTTSADAVLRALDKQREHRQ